MTTKVFASSFVDASGTKQFSCQINRETSGLPLQICMGNSHDTHLLFVSVRLTSTFLRIHFLPHYCLPAFYLSAHIVSMSYYALVSQIEMRRPCRSEQKV